MVTHKATTTRWLRSWWSFFLGSKACPYLTIPVKFIARHCCPEGPPIPAAGTSGNLGRNQNRLITNGRNVALPPYPNHPTPSIKNTFLKQILVGTWSMDCPGNGGSKDEGNSPLQMGRTIQGRSFPSSNDIPGKKSPPGEGGWHFSQTESANTFHLGYS